MLDGRVGLSLSAALSDERLVVGVVPREDFGAGGMFGGWWELVVDWEAEREEAEPVWRMEPEAGGVGECRVFMVESGRRCRCRCRCSDKAGRSKAASMGERDETSRMKMSGR